VAEPARAAPARVPDFVPQAVADAEDQARYGAIVDYLRDYRGAGACFAALPTVSGLTGALELDTFGLQSKDLSGFAEGLEREAGLQPVTYQREITSAQCAALRFVTGLRDYPAFSLAIDLEQRDVPNGGMLRGAIRHAGAREVHLLLVDDEGNVLVLDGFLRDDDAAQSFDVGPLNQTAQGVVTQQLLLALALPEPLPVIVEAANAPMPAEAFFDALAAQVTGPVEAATGLGLVAFAVVE
jgi:serine/threonine-protein kinase